MSTELTTLERVTILGDLSALSPDDRGKYYGAVCRSLGLNPLTRPFEYLELNNKLVLYARRDATDQLRDIKNVSVSIKARELVDGVYVVTAGAALPSGRTDEAIGAVSLVKEAGEWKTTQSGKRFFQGNGQFSPIAPEDRANAMMKAETKAKRRVTLSICGLGMLDETDVETMQQSETQTINVSPKYLDRPPTLLDVKTAYDAAMTVPEFSRARDLAKHLAGVDKDAAREHDKATLERLRQPATTVNAPLVPSEQEQDAGAQKLLARPTLKDALVAIRAGDHALAADIARHLPKDEAAAVEAEISI